MKKKILPLLFMFIALLQYESNGQCVTTFQPGPAQGIDATTFHYPICQRPNGQPRPCDTTNRGNNPHLYASARQQGGIDQIMRAFLKFDLKRFGKLQSDALPSEVILNLFYYRNAIVNNDHIGDNAFVIERLIQPWEEDTIRWAFPANSGQLRMPVATKQTGPKNQIEVASLSSPTADVAVDITEMVRFWMTKPDSNFGFVIRLQDESTERQVHFASSDYPDAQFRPSLEMEFPKVVANAGNDTLICDGTGGFLRASGADEYQWRDVTSGNDILNQYDIYNPFLRASKVQTFEVIANTGTCTDRDTIVIDHDIPRPASISRPTGDTTICLGDSLSVQGGGGTTIRWLPDTLFNNPNSPITFLKPSSTTKIFLEVESAGDKCPGRDSIEIEVLNNTEGDLSFTDTSICRGDSVRLEASGGAFYEWSPQDSVSNFESENPITSPYNDIELIVSIRNPNSCPDFDTLNITVTGSISADAGLDATICEGDSVQLNGDGAGAYNWRPSENLTDAFVQNPIAYPDTTTMYYLRIVGVTDCRGEDSVLITVLPKPDVEVNTLDTTICENQDFTLTASGAATYTWSTGEQSDKTIVNFSDKQNEVTVVGDDGTCQSDTIRIAIKTERCGEPFVIAPKYFSPNGDGIQDAWKIQDIMKYPDNEVTVMNKWGTIIYRKEGYDNLWDGTFNGQAAAGDTYLYLIRVNVDGEDVIYKGTVTIIR